MLSKSASRFEPWPYVYTPNSMSLIYHLSAAFADAAVAAVVFAHLVLPTFHPLAVWASVDL